MHESHSGEFFHYQNTMQISQKKQKKKETYETDNSHEIESDILRGPVFVLDDVDSCCPHHYKSKITGPWSL